MPKKQLIDLVNKLKNAGINISFTKPKAEFLSTLHQGSQYTPTANGS